MYVAKTIWNQKCLVTKLQAIQKCTILIMLFVKNQLAVYTILIVSCEVMLRTCFQSTFK